MDKNIGIKQEHQAYNSNLSIKKGRVTKAPSNLIDNQANKMTNLWI